LEATHTNTIFNVVQQIAYIHGRVNIIRDRERIQNKYMEEKDHFTLLYSQLSLLHLQLLKWQQAAAIAALHFLS
jgi:hypothetical protein